MTSFSVPEPWFSYIKNGEKKYDIRLGNPIIRQFEKNHYVYIKNANGLHNDGIPAYITQIDWFTSFMDAVKSIPFNQYLPNYYGSIDQVIIEFNNKIHPLIQKEQGIVIFHLQLDKTFDKLKLQTDKNDKYVTLNNNDRHLKKRCRHSVDILGHIKSFKDCI